MKKFFIYLITLFFAVIVFMPKENIFFLLQKELLKQDVYITSTAEDKYMFMSLNNTKIYYKSLKVSDIDDINMYLFFLFNKLNIKNISINFNNIKIKNLNITYTLFSPLKIFVKGISNKGKIEGVANLQTQKIKIYIYNLTDKNLQSFLKKDNKGYFYETKL